MHGVAAVHPEEKQNMYGPTLKEQIHRIQWCGRPDTISLAQPSNMAQMLRKTRDRVLPRHLQRNHDGEHPVNNVRHG